MTITRQLDEPAWLAERREVARRLYDELPIPDPSLAMSPGTENPLPPTTFGMHIIELEIGRAHV